MRIPAKALIAGTFIAAFGHAACAQVPTINLEETCRAAAGEFGALGKICGGAHRRKKTETAHGRSAGRASAEEIALGLNGILVASLAGDP